jgi:nitronate monooxygenase
LVAAVSNAGGLGILAASRLTPMQLKQSISEIKSKTNLPFGVNILLAPPEEGNHDIATVQNYLDSFRRNLHIQDGPRNISLPPSMIATYLDIIYEEKVPVLYVFSTDLVPVFSWIFSFCCPFLSSHQTPNCSVGIFENSDIAD